MSASEYFLRLLAFFALLFVLWLGWLVWKWAEGKRLERRVATMPFPERYRDYLRRIPHYRGMDAEERRRIERSILRFMLTKRFVGVKLEITDEMKVVIAFYACLPLLNLPEAGCYPPLKTILVYPAPVVYEDVRNNGGIYSKARLLLDGQAAGETVVIVWNAAKKQAYHLRHDNVIIHEFAHELDMLDGAADGVPPLERSKYDTWMRTLYRTYKTLRNRVMQHRKWGKYKVLGEYAATNEAEFFAVVSERFFESPLTLKRHFPELYELLKEVYRVDPAQWLEKAKKK